MTQPFTALAKNQSKVFGLPNLQTVVAPHPFGGIPVDQAIGKVEAAYEELISKLTTPLPPAAALAAFVAKSEWVEFDPKDEWADLQAFFMERGWGDGMLAAPPTEERVAAMVKGSGYAPGHVVAVLAPKMGIATVECMAANAVMAGCKPQHMPLLIAALQAMAESQFNLYGIQGTTHCVAPLMIVNGPLAAKLGIHSGSGLFGPGPWANGVVGRAIRLMLLNIGGAKPVEMDKATMGHPGKYTYCMAENEAALPPGWPTLAAERGFAPDVSTVTMLGGEAPHNINDHDSTVAGGVLTMICHTITETGQNNVNHPGEPLLLLGPEHAATIAREGYTKDEVKRVLYEDARIPLSHFSAEQIERRLVRYLPRRYKDRPLSTGVPLAQRWEDFMVVVAGGPGKHSMYVPTFGSTRSVTKAVARPDGSPWRPGDFK
jgi:hypothetical protein